MSHQRILIYLSVIFVLVGLTLPRSGHSAPALPEHGRALSLRVLQERAADCQRTGRCEDVVTHLAFLRRIDGFVIDRERQDLVLIGQVDPSWPKLHLQDWVIALRDAWHLYDRRRGNIIYRSDPGVSIDPYPQVIERLQEIGEALDGESGYDPDSVLDAWHKVCHLPQQVRVEGIPFDTRFSATMLEVDYDLKRIADGSIVLDLDGHQSLSSRYLESAKQQIKAGKSASLSSMSRFWFYPKPLMVQADDTTAIIDSGFGLKVLTEEEHLNAAGQITGKGTPNPHAEAFARSISTLFPQIAESRPTWRDLENLAWMVALARTVRYRDAVTESGLNINWLLDNFQLPETEVQDTVPGHSNVHLYDYRQAVSGGYVIGALRLPSCGGVEMDVNVDERTFQRPGRKINVIYHHVTNSRPNDDVLYWDF